MAEYEDPLSILGAYLHQDWTHEYGADFHAAIRALALEAPEVTLPLAERIRWLLQSDMPDDKLTALLSSVMDFAFWKDDLTPRQFLEEVLRLIVKAS